MGTGGGVPRPPARGEEGKGEGGGWVWFFFFMVFEFYLRLCVSVSAAVRWAAVRLRKGLCSVQQQSGRMTSDGDVISLYNPGLHVI